jgi:hypothetical protein
MVISGEFPIVFPYTAALIKLAAVVRSAGAHFFIDTGSGWWLVWSSVTNTNDPLFCGMNAFSLAFTCDYFHNPQFARWLPAPIISDGFGSAFGLSDGLAHLEQGGMGRGGHGAAWTQQVGAWTVASGRASASATSGGIAIATVQGGTKDVLADIKLTRSAGQGGLLLRYTDASNYLYANHDGTNCFLKQVLAGVTTTLITAAAAYSANAVIRVDLNGVGARLYYNNTLVGTTASINAALTATLHGLYVTDVTANLTVDDLIVWPKGTGNEYAILDTF